MELIKLKSFYTTKEIINKMKRQLSQWEIISNAATIKGLISKTCKSYTMQYQKNQKPNQNMIEKN